MLTFYAINDRMLKQTTQQGHGRRANQRRTLLLQYVDDSHEPRTQVMAWFSIRLEEPLSAEKEGARHPGMGHTESDTAFPLVNEVLLVQRVHDIKPQQQLLSMPG